MRRRKKKKKKRQNVKLKTQESAQSKHSQYPNQIWGTNNIQEINSYTFKIRVHIVNFHFILMEC